MPALQVIHSGAHTPLENMARDEALLASDCAPTLRLYSWHPFGLSIGYFQRLADFVDVPGEHELVRRTTGGGAIYHAEELTFALVGPDSTLPREIDAGYAAVHAGIAHALARFGVTAQRFGRGAKSPRPDQQWCFTRPSCHDLVTQRGKIVGSAQRRSRGRILHHGSIVLRAPAVTPECGAVDEFREPTPILAELSDALGRDIASSLGREPVELSESATPCPDASQRAAIAERLGTR